MLSLISHYSSVRLTLLYLHHVQGVIQHQIAECRLEIDQARLLTLKAANTIDKFGTKVARKQVRVLSFQIFSHQLL